MRSGAHPRWGRQTSKSEDSERADRCLDTYRRTRVPGIRQVEKDNRSQAGAILCFMEALESSDTDCVQF